MTYFAPPHPTTSRRGFLKGAAAAGAALSAPYFAATRRSLGEELAAEKMAIGLIGCGGMGMGNLRAASQWLRVAAVCDADAARARRANKALAGGGASLYDDYRAMLDRKDISVLHIATPDHWHAKPLIEAMRAGKDVYCEKPLTLTIDEGKQVCSAQKETRRVVQVGTQQRSTFDLFVKAMALVAEGRLGKIKRLQAAIGGAPTSPALPVATPPAELDWDKWLGPAPLVDYRELAKGEGRNRKHSNGHYEFRWWYEYSGGKLTDWGAHHVDICHWALALNGQDAGPVSLGGQATHPVEFAVGEAVQKDRYNTATAFHLTVGYPGGVEMVIRSDTANGVLIEGDRGRIFVNRGRLTGRPVEELEDNPLPEGAIQRVYKGAPVEQNERRAHWANFLHCVRTRTEPIADVHSHMQMLNVCHLAGIAARLGRPLKWDEASQQVIGDEQAAAMLARPARAGYETELG